MHGHAGHVKRQTTINLDVEKCRTWVLPPGLVATLRLIFPVDFVLMNLIVCPHVRCFTELQRQLEMLADTPLKQVHEVTVTPERTGGSP